MPYPHARGRRRAPGSHAWTLTLRKRDLEERMLPQVRLGVTLVAEARVERQDTAFLSPLAHRGKEHASDPAAAPLGRDIQIVQPRCPGAGAQMWPVVLCPR